MTLAEKYLVSWTEHISDEQILEKINYKKELITIIKYRNNVYLVNESW